MIRPIEIESLQHLLFNCEIGSLWEACRCWLMSCKIESEPLTIVEVLSGIFNTGEDLILVSHLIPAAKLCIYKCKLKGSHPVLRVLRAKIKG